MSLAQAQQIAARVPVSCRGAAPAAGCGRAAAAFWAAAPIAVLVQWAGFWGAGAAWGASVGVFPSPPSPAGQ